MSEAQGAKAFDLPPLSRKESVILGMLVESRRSLYGLEMVEASRGALKRGTIYVTLQRLQDKGFVDSRPEPRTAPEIGIPRRMYRISALGQRVFSAYETAGFMLAQGLLSVNV
jgi:PadR family transcriptional regulator PadR